MRGSAQGRLSRDVLMYGLGNSAAQAVNVLFVPVFTRVFSPAEFGALEFLLTVNAIGVLVSQAGLNSAMLFYYRRHADLAERRKMVATALAIGATIALVLAVVGLIFAAPISRALLRSDTYTPAVALTFVWVPVTLLANLALDLLRLEFRAGAYSVLGVGRTLAASAVGALLAGPLAMGVAGLLLAYVVIGLGSLVLTLFLARSSWDPRFDPAAARNLLRFGLPLVPAGLAYWIIAYSDRYLIIQLLGTAAAGIYSLANRVAMGVMLVIYAFEAAWWPYAFAKAREADHREVFARVLSAFSAGMVVLALAIGLFAREILLILTTREFLSAYPYVGTLALALVVHGAYSIVGIGVQLAQRTQHMAWTSGVAAIVNVGLNLVLIPRVGILGAALATLAAYGLSTGLIYSLAQRAYPIPYRLQPLVALLVGSAVLMAVGLWLDSQASGDEWSPVVTLTKALVYAGVVAALLVRIGIGPRKAISQILKVARRV
jgi:O-antigen/teichoic acid export membrane protein